MSTTILGCCCIIMLAVRSSYRWSKIQQIFDSTLSSDKKIRVSDKKIHSTDNQTLGAFQSQVVQKGTNFYS